VPLYFAGISLLPYDKIKNMELPVKNWLIYDVLVSGKFREGDVTVTVTDKKPVQNDITQKAVNQLWSDMIKGRKSVGKETWNSRIYSLIEHKKQDDKLILDLGITTFKYLQGTNATYWLLGDIYGRECLANGLLVQTLVFDKKGNCIFGKRNTGVKKEYEPYVIFGGTMDKDDKEGREISGGQDPFKAIKIELEEELGVVSEDIEDAYIKFIVQDRKYYPVIYFYTFLNLEFSELRQKFLEVGDKSEHSDIVILEEGEMRILLEATPEKAKDLTLTAIDLYLKHSR
jgi:hypothetical protein